jgi:hypothetical protein
MKNIIFPILLLTALASCDKDTEQNAVVIKDCTGSYIRQDSSDYFICNDESVANFENGSEVSVIYKTVESCEESVSWAICLMGHLSEGSIEITEIK